MVITTECIAEITMENAQVIRISAAGLKDIDLKVLEVAYALLMDDGFNCELLNPPDICGEVIVIDIENEHGKRLYNNIKESQIKIAITNETIVAKNTVSLKKPVRVTTLKQVLAQICQQVHDYIERQENIKNNNLIKNTNSVSSSESSIFQILFSAKRDGKFLKISHSDNNDIFVNGPGKTIHSNSDQVIPATIITGESKDILVSELDNKEYLFLTKNITPHALDTELWKTGIECSRGRLLPGHRTDVAVKLKAWPNFSRQGFKAEFFKIAAYIAKQAISLDELSKVSQMPLNIIVDFYNAAFSVGLIETDINQDAQNMPVKHISSVKKTLLSKLAQRLKFA